MDASSNVKMDASMEEEEYNWREVALPVVPEPELDRETGERRRGRDIIIAVDHGPSSRHAFDWAITHLCRLADTIHLIHAISSLKNQVVYETTQGLMEKLSSEAFEVAMVKTKARIVEGDAGKVICKEAERLKPAAVVMGTSGRSLFQSVIHGSVSEYCFHNCKTAPIIIVPMKGRGRICALVEGVRKRSHKQHVCSCISPREDMISCYSRKIGAVRFLRSFNAPDTRRGNERPSWILFSNYSRQAQTSSSSRKINSVWFRIRAQNSLRFSSSKKGKQVNISASCWAVVHHNSHENLIGPRKARGEIDPPYFIQ